MNVLYISLFYLCAKSIKFGKDLTKFWQKQVGSFFGTLYAGFEYSLFLSNQHSWPAEFWLYFCRRKSVKLLILLSFFCTFSVKCVFHYFVSTVIRSDRRSENFRQKLILSDRRCKKWYVQHSRDSLPVRCCKDADTFNQGSRPTNDLNPNRISRVTCSTNLFACMHSNTFRSAIWESLSRIDTFRSAI